jgi:competence protein ComEC
MRAALEGRPLFVGALAFIFGVASLSQPINLLALAGLLLICKNNLRALLFSAGGFLFGLCVAPIRVMPLFESGPFEEKALIVSIPRVTANGESCLIETGEGRYQLLCRGPVALALGQRVHVRGTLRKLHGEAGQMLSLQEVRATVSCSSTELTSLDDPPALFDWSMRWRESFSQSVLKTLPGHEGLLVTSLVFGSGAAPAGAVREELNASGGTYLLTVSGLQVFLLAWLLHLLLLLFPINRRTQLIVAGAVLLLYVCASGLTPSAIRALIVTLLASFAYLARREPDLPTAIGLAGVCTVLWQPWSIFTPSFQVSFVVVLALALYWKRMERPARQKLTERVASSLWGTLRMSFIVFVAAAPLLAYHFGRVFLLAPITTLLAAPVAPIIIVCSLLGWALLFFAPSVQVGLLLFVVGPLAAWVLFISSILSAHGWATVLFPPFEAYWLVPYYLAFLIIWERSAGSRL